MKKVVRKKMKSKSKRVLVKRKSNSERSGDHLSFSGFSSKAVLFILLLLILVSVSSIIFYEQAMEEVPPQKKISSGGINGKVVLTILPQEPVSNLSEKGVVGVAYEK